MKKSLTIALTTLALVTLMTPALVNAEETKVTVKKVCKTVTGQYGTTKEECTEEKVEENVLGAKDEVKPIGEDGEPGLGDINFTYLATLFGITGFATLGLSKLTKNIYLFD